MKKDSKCHYYAMLPRIFISGVFYAQECDAQGCVRKLVGLRSLPKEFSLKKLYFQEEIV